MTVPALSILEARVLGVLVEKQHTVPDIYPMSINALAAGCNQKSSRDPVMDAAEAEVQAAVDNLKRLSLVLETSGGRVMRYAHNFGRVLGIPAQATALLAVLMLRGPQTAAELRANSERLYRFGDTSAVEAFLRELAERAAGALVVELPRQPGAREPRWAHLLSGPPAGAQSTPDQPATARSENVPATATTRPDPAPADEIASLRAEVSSLAAEVHTLRALVARLCKQLGVDPE